MNPASNKLLPSVRAYYLIPAIIIILVYVGIKAYNGGDFRVYLHAAEKLSQSENIYQPPFYSDMAYIYSTFFALLLVPFSYLPYTVTAFIWLLANVFFLYRLWQLICFYLDAQFLSRKYYRILLLLSFIFTLRFLLYNFDMIQLTIFLMYGSLESIYLITKGKKVAGSTLLAIVMNIKLLPLVLVPYLIYRKEFLAALLSLSFFALLLFVPALFIGYDFNLTLLEDWWKTINPANAARTAGEVTNGPHGLPALIPVLFMKTTGSLPYQRHVLDLNYTQVFYILNAIRLLLVFLTLYFLRTLPFRPAPHKLQTLYEMSYLFLITPLLAPQQQKYAFFYMFPAVVYLIYFMIAFKSGRAAHFSLPQYRMVFTLLFVAFALTTLSSDVIIGRTLNEITQHYRFITYGVLLLIVPLAICKPAYLVKAGDKAYVHTMQSAGKGNV